jgi:hypothetical protein
MHDGDNPSFLDEFTKFTFFLIVDLNLRTITIWFYILFFYHSATDQAIYLFSLF